jgi:hypothetical protein
LLFEAADCLRCDILVAAASRWPPESSTTKSRNAALLSSNKYIAFTQMVLLVSFAPPFIHSLLSSF